MYSQVRTLATLWDIPCGYTLWSHITMTPRGVGLWPIWGNNNSFIKWYNIIWFLLRDGYCKWRGRTNERMQWIWDREQTAEWLTGSAGRVLCVGAKVLDSHIAGPDWIFLPTHLHCAPMVKRGTSLHSRQTHRQFLQRLQTVLLLIII